MGLHIATPNRMTTVAQLPVVLEIVLVLGVALPGGMSIETVETLKMEDNCYQEISMIISDLPQGRLQLTTKRVFDVKGYPWKPDTSICETEIEAWFSRPRLMFYFEHFRLDCAFGYLEFLDGVQNSKPIYDGPCEDYRYRCDNDRCIDRDVSCNGMNSCGDNSTCRVVDADAEEEVPVYATARIVGGCITFVMVLIAMWFCVRRCRRRQRASARSTSQPAEQLTSYQLQQRHIPTQPGTTVIGQSNNYAPPPGQPTYGAPPPGQPSDRTPPSGQPPYGAPPSGQHQYAYGTSQGHSTYEQAPPKDPYAEPPPAYSKLFPEKGAMPYPSATNQLEVEGEESKQNLLSSDQDSTHQ